MNLSQLGRRKFLNQLFAYVAPGLLVIAIASCSSPSNQANSGTATNKSPSANPASSGEPGRVLRVGFISSDSKVPIGPEGWAQQKGDLLQTLQTLGISEVKFIPFDGGPALNEALSSNQLDLAFYGDTPALVGRSAGLKTKLINQARVGQDAWLITRKEGVQTVEELRGQRVGVAKGTYLHRYLLGLLEQKGLVTAVKVVQIKSSDARSALERGDIAAYPFATGIGPILLEKGGFKSIDQAKNHKDLVGTSVSIITEEALANYPQLPQKWNQVRQKALAEIRSNPDAFYQFAVKSSGNLSLANVKESYAIELYPTEPCTPDGLKLLNSTKQFLADQKLLKSDFEIKDWQVANP
jgi:NitT/TauT family transport system substrate-binding protein/sulfonate transport system substrate-binding protein